jgi:PAS domain S-box-containing protein
MLIQNQPIRILIVDDDEDDFLICSDYIKGIESGEFIIDGCFRYKEALEKILKKEYDLYFVDYHLGSGTGLDLLRDAMAAKCEEPIILFTGKGNPRIDKEATSIGAYDYLIKSELNTEKFERCIRYSLERATSLKALRNSENKYRNVFERSKDAIFIANEKLKFKDINQAASQLLGYDRKELLQLSFYDFIERDSVKSKIENDLRRNGEVNDLEIVVANSREERKNCILYIAGQRSDNEETYFQVIIHDITKLKKAEKITLQAEKLAAAGRLIRTLAHEVRNPLNNIQMSVEELESDIGEDGRSYLEIIRRNSERINGLINELLNSSRPTEMHRQNISLRDVLSRSIQMAGDRIMLKNIKVESNFEDKPCIISADEDKLKIAFLNILINATEAITSTDGKILVSLSCQENFCRIEIADNGCGISSDNVSKLFEPYFTSKRNGMGLGLASTLNIVQAHKGIVEVKSEIGVGTTFIITFFKSQTQKVFENSDVQKMA